jgi:UDP-3-O-acyl-N-acetylglucosamine deacetylase
VKYRLDYKECAAIGRQTYEGIVDPETFQRDLAPARTFMLKPEAEWLRSKGLGMRVGPSDVLVFDGNGPIENQLRFRDECVRHKTLDLVGDLALSGCDIVAQVVAYRSGHRLNAELVRILLTEGSILESTRKTA